MNKMRRTFRGCFDSAAFLEEPEGGGGEEGPRTMRGSMYIRRADLGIRGGSSRRRENASHAARTLPRARVRA